MICIITLIVSLLIQFPYEMNPSKGEEVVYRIPPRDLPINLSDGNISFEMPDIINGVPIIPQYVTVATIADRGLLMIPVLMYEPELPFNVEVRLIDPMLWEEKSSSTQIIGRRSIWFMEINSTMLYSVIIDLGDGNVRDIGVGYIVIKRVDHDHYDVLMEDTRGVILFAGRGKLHKIDESIGQGTFIPIDNQAAIREMYDAKWDLDPSEFILFGRSQ